jgi:2-methylcitrate dehydratase PrpD
VPPDTITARVARYVTSMDTREIPDAVLDEARKCLVDYIAVCVQALPTPEGRIMRDVIGQWRSQGRASLIGGGMAAPMAAAMFNGTLSHCLDFDDTHIPSVVHISGPLWAALLAVGAERDIDEQRMLRAFVTGFEVDARLGDHGVGVRLNQGGWHATPTLGGFGVACGIAAMLGLDASKVSHALALCATQAGGLAASFGSMAKPMHSGKAAADGVMAAALAEAGFTGAADPLDPAGRFLATLLQDPGAQFTLPPFDPVWEITRNSFKPYAACQLAHGAIDAAQRVRPRVAGRPVRRITAFVHPLAVRIATVTDPVTPTQGKFCVGFCVALALSGRPLSNDDFSPENLRDPWLRDMTGRVEMRATGGIERTATRLEIELASGESLVEDVAHAFGSIGNPMDWASLDAKFIASTRALLGANAPVLLQALHRFGDPGSLARLFALTRPLHDPLAAGADLARRDQPAHTQED